MNGEPGELDVPSIDWALSTTRSVRRRLDLDRPVPRQVLYECIDVAVQAPTGPDGESWRFLVIDEPEPRQALARLYRDALAELAAGGQVQPKATVQTLADTLDRIPVLILVCAAGRPPDTDGGQVAYFASVLPAAWSLMVSLRARGLGSTWTTLLSTRQQEVARILDIPADVTQTVMLPVAYTRDARLRPADRLPAQQVSYFNRWGAGDGDPEV